MGNQIVGDGGEVEVRLCCPQCRSRRDHYNTCRCHIGTELKCVIFLALQAALLGPSCWLIDRIS